MMTTNEVIAFLLFATVAAGTPGPSNLILTSTGARVGVLRGLASVAGVALGMALLMAIVAAGVGAVVVDNPLVLLALKWGGAVALLWLAWKIATAGRLDLHEEKPPIGFWGAAAFQWINPKSWLVCVSAAGTYWHAGTHMIWLQAAELGLLFVLAAVPCCFLWLAFGAGIQGLLRTERASRVFNVAMGVLLAGTILFIIW